jgi:hypothetical protein
MTAPSVPAEGDGDPFLSLSPSEASEGRTGAPEGTVPVSGDLLGDFGGVTPVGGGGFGQKSPRLVFTDQQYQRECVLAYAMAVEHIRVAEPADAGVTTRYVNQVVDNSRLLSGGNARLHLNLLRSQVRWLKSLKLGELS